MDEFDYSNDIAPLKGNYFRDKYSGSTMSQDERRGLELMELKGLEDRLVQDLNFRKISNDLRSSEIQFEEQKLQLEKMKNDAKIERESLTTIPEATKHLDGILNNPNTSDSEKAYLVADYKFQNAPLIGVSKSFNNLLASAEGKLESRKQETEQVKPLVNALVQSGQPEALKKVLGGKNFAMADEYVATAEAIAASKKSESVSETALKEQEYARGMEKEMRASQTALLTDYMGTIRKLTPPKPKTDELEIGTLGGNKNTSAIPKVETLKYTKEDRAELEEIVRSLNENVDEQRLLSAPDIDLYKAALESTTGTLKNLAGFKSQFRRDKFRNTPTE
jgi:hypothetical protein